MLLKKYAASVLFVASGVLLLFLRTSHVVPCDDPLQVNSSNVTNELHDQATLGVKETDKDEWAEVTNRKSSAKAIKSSSYEDYSEEISEDWPPVLTLSNGEALKNIDYSQYDSQNQEFLLAKAADLTKRAEMMGKACKKKGLGLHSKKRLHLIWDKTHTPSIVWCPIYKVASTTWLTNFLRLAHFNENNTAIPTFNKTEEQIDKMRFLPLYGGGHKYAFEYFPSPESVKEKLKLLKKSLRVLIVRHPFSRILSAYRDKMTRENQNTARFGFRQIQKSIVAKYRSRNSKNKSKFPTFPEFVQYVIDSTKKLRTAKDWQNKVKCWIPYWVHCDVCTLDYNVIMKLETMQEDERFLVTVSRLEELKGQHKWLHLKGNSSMDLKEEYYGQVTRSQMYLLRQRYGPDFDLFGYDINEYLAIAKDA